MSGSKKKYSKADQDYIARRTAFAEKYDRPDLWSIVDHWPLYAGVYSLSRFIAISKLVEQSLTVPGHIGEVGSWRGANLLFMAKLIRLFDPHSNKQVHSFDAFEGLQQFSPEDGDATRTKGFYRGSLDELLDVIALYDLEDEVVIHRGLVEETLPPLLAERTELSFSMIYIDVDLYAPTLLALREFHNRLSLGGMIVFDEWNIAMFPGETVAVREFLAETSGSYVMEHVRNTRQPSLVLRKVAL
jgi:hypothetical protein